MKRISFLFVAFLFLLFLAWIGTPHCLCQQNAEQSLMSDPQEKQEPEKIVGAPQDAKQKTGIWVFVVWMWISVFVIIYFLRLKIKEVDSLYRLRFYTPKKS
jgi:hypothetical protein